MIVIGDSIAAGQYFDGEAWPALLGATNLGVSNDTTRLMLERFASVQTSGAKACVIQAGHNDANIWETDKGLPRVSRLAFAANLQEMIQRCRVFEIKPYLCTITPVLRLEKYQRNLDSYDRILREVAGITVTTVIDTHQAFIRFDLKDLLLSDGLHLSEGGHRLYAQTVKEAL